MQKKQAIIFDCYGTLYIYGDLKLAWKKWANTFCETLNKYYSIEKENILSSLDGMFSSPKPEMINEGFTLFEQRIFNKLEEMGFNPDHQAITDIAESTMSAWHDEISFDNIVPEMLRYLKQSYRLALLSNFDHPKQIHTMLQKDNIHNYFEEIFVSGDIGYDKPDPGIYEYALRKMSLSNSEVIYVGDSEEDYLGCINTDIDFILISRNSTSKMKLSNDYKNDTTELEADWTSKYDDIRTINSLSELLTL